MTTVGGCEAGFIRIPCVCFQLAQDSLSPLEFELLWLKYVDELADSDIAAIQSRSPGAIRTGLLRVRRKLIEILKSEKVLE